MDQPCEKPSPSTHLSPSANPSSPDPNPNPGEELRGTDEPWETMIASMMMNGTGASDVISSSLSAAPSGGNLTPATVA